MAERPARFGSRVGEAMASQVRKRRRCEILLRLWQNKIEEFPNRESAPSRLMDHTGYLRILTPDSEITHFVRDDKSCAASAGLNLKIDFFTQRCVPKKCMSWPGRIG